MAGTFKDCKKAFHSCNKKNPKKYSWSITGKMVQLPMTEKWHSREKIYLFVHRGEKVG